MQHFSSASTLTTGLISFVLVSFLLCLFWFALSCPRAHAQIYKYKNEDGVWIFTDTPIELPDHGVDIVDNVGSTSSPGTGVNLSEQLSAELKPANEIERAALSVVKIKSPLGHGTGFFLTDTGYIATNKHVLQLTEQEKTERKTVRSEAEEKITTAKKNLALEQEKLAVFKKQLDEYARKISTLDSKRDRELARENHAVELKRYQSWYSDFQKRQRELKTKVSAYRDQVRQEDYNASRSALKERFTIRLADNSSLSARLVHVSPHLDLALLKLDGYTTPYLRPAAGSTIAQGQQVYAIGNPMTLKNSVSKGVMSGRQGVFIKTEAKIYPGNSGGPLINAEGNVIGINTFKELTHKFEGLGFALSMDTVMGELGTYISK
ncbi:MAG: trypsin-like peptidase domain-containing protein [Desulfobacterales bacterium]|nr:trypsin-like peptidase domain-containing protein [Desulfobacterales bacterium]